MKAKKKNLFIQQIQKTTSSSYSVNLTPMPLSGNKGGDRRCNRLKQELGVSGGNAWESMSKEQRAMGWETKGGGGDM